MTASNSITPTNGIVAKLESLGFHTKTFADILRASRAFGVGAIRLAVLFLCTIAILHVLLLIGATLMDPVVAAKPLSEFTMNDLFGNAARNITIPIAFFSTLVVGIKRGMYWTGALGK